MDIPGLSLFQGAESIKLNTEQQRVEEEDAIEDRKRRNEEVRYKMKCYAKFKEINIFFENSNAVEE